MRKRRTLALLLAVAVVLGLVAAGSASAFNKKQRAHEKRQNAAIGRVAKATARNTNRIAALTTSVNTQTKSLADLTTLVTGIDNRLKAIEAGVPAVLDGLNKLADAANQLKDGLTQLKTGLEQAGAGLNSLKTLATSQEYGFGQLIVLNPGPNAEAGSFVETPDIPDAVQQAQTEQQFVAQHTGNLAVAYGVRSNESDGTGASNPAAVCKVTVTNAGGTTQTTAANPSLGGLPFQPVNNKSAMTSTDPANAGFPFGLKQTGADADQTTTFVSTVPVTAGATYTVGLACVDTSPSTTDPSA
jgi:X-X-X-Leu-X-X-Gly heptad repeat protein